MHYSLDAACRAGMKNPLDRVRVPRHNPRNVEGRTGAYQYFLKVRAVCVGVSHVQIAACICASPACHKMSALRYGK